MFLHLIHADRKFLGPIRAMFEAAAPGRHTYVVVGEADGWAPPRDLLHLDQGEQVPGVVGGEEWEGVLLHGLPFTTAAPLVDVLPPTVPVAWYVWGFEAYDSWKPLRRGLLLPETQRVAERVAPPAWKRWASGSLSRARGRRRDVRRVVSRYDYCVTQYREEYELFVRSGLLSGTRYHEGSVGSFEDAVDTSAAPARGEDVQVGNSASLSNNHLDAFLLLGGLGLDGRRIVVPLGYGSEAYRREVMAAGRRTLGERFTPLAGFIPLQQYLQTMTSCGHVIMNHLRQQALGNIYAALWRGAAVYMNDTPAYRGLRRAGFSVRLIGETLAQGGGRLRPEPEAQVSDNRDRLRALLGRAAVTSRTQDLLERLASTGRGAATAVTAGG